MYGKYGHVLSTVLSMWLPLRRTTKIIECDMTLNHLVSIVLHNIADAPDDETQANNDPSRHMMFTSPKGFRVPRALNTSLCIAFGGFIGELAPMHGLFRGD
jgi:hypothetical protein